MDAYPGISSYVGDDISRAFKRAPNIASGLGAATREAVVGPVSYGIGAIGDMVKAPAEAATDFARGLTGSPTAPAPRPAAPAVATPATVAPLAGATASAAAPAPVQPAGGMQWSTADNGTRTLTGDGPAPQMMAISTAARGDQLRRAYAPTADGAPVAGAPAVDPNSAILASMNDGTWSGMLNAKMMARRLDATRQNDVARTAAATGQYNAETGRLSAMSNVAKTGADIALTGEHLKTAANTTESGKLDLEAKREEAALRAAAANGDEKALAKLRNLTAARQGKAPEEAVNEKLLDAYLKHASEYAKDPSNIGKPPPSFQDFVGGLPAGMFPQTAKYATPLPSGMKRQVGTANGKPVYEGADGKRYAAP